MKKHFELTSESIVNAFGVKLFRIKATVDIATHGVNTGDTGGFVEKEANLSGNAWVSGDARVSGNARVSGDAWDISPLQIQGTRHFINFCAKGMLKIGCIIKSIHEWQDTFRSVGKEHGYSGVEIAEYEMHINAAAQWHAFYENKIKDSTETKLNK